MNPSTQLSAELVDAYRQTHYRVFADPPFVLSVDGSSVALAALHARFGVVGSAFLTAWNPFSRRTSSLENAARQVELTDALHAACIVYIEGEGAHPSNGWTPEASVLALGVTLDAAKALGTSFEQNAIVWCGEDAVARLVLLR